MKCIFFSYLIGLLLLQISSFAQLKKLPVTKAEQISQWLTDYSSFIELENEKRVALYKLYERRFLQKDSIHNVKSLSIAEKYKQKIDIDKTIDELMQKTLTLEEYVYIKCHHQTIGRLQKINFIADLDAVNTERLLVAMREMRYKNVMLINQHGKYQPSVKKRMMENRAHCSAIERQIFTKDMYDHLYEMDLLTVIDWTEEKQDELSTIMNGYNILDPMDDINE